MVDRAVTAALLASLDGIPPPRRAAMYNNERWSIGYRHPRVRLLVFAVAWRHLLGGHSRSLPAITPDGRCDWPGLRYADRQRSRHGHSCLHTAMAWAIRFEFCDSRRRGSGGSNSSCRPLHAAPGSRGVAASRSSRSSIGLITRVCSPVRFSTTVCLKTRWSGGEIGWPSGEKWRKWTSSLLS